MADKSLPMIFVTAGVVIAGLIGYGVINQGTETVDTVAKPVKESTQSSGTDKADSETQQESSETPNQAAENSQEAGEVDTASLSSDETTSETSDENVQKPEVKPIIPTYDLLRIEPDGSAVIAGQAAPNSDVALLDGDDVIANTKAGSGGDFAIILDQPLSSGLHQLTLQTKDADGNITESEEQGIVEVPAEGSADKPTVLVSKPGEATRVLQKPEIAENEKPEPVETAKVEETTEPEDQTQQTEENAESDTNNVVSATDSASVDLAKPDQETAEASQTEQAENKTQGDEATTGFGGTVTIGETAEETTESANQETAALANPEEDTAANPETNGNDATTEPVPVPTPAPKVEDSAEPEPVKQVAPVLLEAADIEGDRIFIAGTGEPGMIANIYLDSEFLGQTEISGNGAFLFEGNRKISAGRYDVRADMVESGSSKVVARAEVSLLHEPEPEVTPQPVQTADVTASEEPEPVVEETENADAQAATQTAAVEKEAVTEQTNQASTSEGSSASETATNLETVNQPTQKLTETNEPTEQLAAITEDKVQLPGQEKAASSSDQATEESTSAGNNGGSVETTQDGTSTNESTSLASNTSGSEKQNQTGTADSVEVETTSSDQSETTEVASLANENEQTTSDADPVETVAKKELRTGTAVIIRRGDSLWRVARRNYGKGIRYTTIFEANRDQVRDADLIYPGQVLKVPELEEETASE